MSGPSNVRESLNILLVEDDTADAFLAQKHLAGTGRHHVVVTPSLTQALSLIENEKFELILSDLNLPDSQGIETVKRLVGCAREVPVVVLTGTDDFNYGAELVAEGAQDFIAKARVSADRLEEVMIHALARQQLWVDAQQAGLYDALTGLPNRALFQSHIDQAIENAHRRNERLLVAYLDLDAFKPVNDAHGHAAGDDLLKQVAVRVARTLRKSDLVARLGGDELAIVMPMIEDVCHALSRIENIASELAAPYLLQTPRGTTSIDNTVSIGVSIYPDHAARGDLLSACADQAMYQAKRLGGNCVQVYSPHLPSDIAISCQEAFAERVVTAQIPAGRLQVLLIEDDEQDKQLIEHVADLANADVDIHWCQTLKEAIAAARNKSFGVALLDLNLNDSQGLDTLQRFVKFAPKLPVIVLTQADHADLGSEAIRAGAQDFLTKDLPDLHAWPRSARHAIERHTLVRNAILAGQRARLANIDQLTGLANRREFLAELETALARVPQEKNQFGIVILDLADFSSINDRLGYLVGDEVLRILGDRLLREFDDGDFVARLGGDEFAAIIYEDCSGEPLRAKLATVQSSLSKAVITDERQLRVGVKMGIACFPAHGHTASVLMHAADTALRHAKHSHERSIVQYTPEMGLASEARAATEVLLRATMHEGGMHLVFQPIIDVESGSLKKLEALLRWRHPDRGLLTPYHFVGVAEDTGLIIPIDHLVLREVCRLSSRWLPHARKKWPGLTFSVNVSATTINQTNYAETAAWLCDEYGLTDNKPTIEVTETALSLDSNNTMAQIIHLQQLGFAVALDDFGTEYSSLSYLHQLRVDEVKIDRTFIANLPEDKRSAILVECIVQMARELGLKVVIEGVETEMQKAMFANKPDVMLQGYLIDKPLELDILERRYKIDATGYRSPH